MTKLIGGGFQVILFLKVHQGYSVIFVAYFPFFHGVSICSSSL
jgi:hypothetical protein